MANTTIQFKDIYGQTVAVPAIDQGDGTYRLGVDAYLDVGDIEIGAVEIKDAVGVARAIVAAGNAIVSTDNALAVHDANLAPPVATAVHIQPHGGEKTVASSGTAEPLVATATPSMMLCAVARIGNTGNIYFGSSAVHHTTLRELILWPGMSVSVDCPVGYRLDVHNFYIDADNPGDGVDFVYVS